MTDYYNINAMYDDSNLRVTMEKYSYNLWALISLVGIMVILKIIDKVYLYNIILIVVIAILFSMYFIYMKGK
jgi:hypothetical protein